MPLYAWWPKRKATVSDAGTLKRAAQAMNATKSMVEGVFEMIGDHAPEEAWDKVAEIDADYYSKMNDWIIHGGNDKLDIFKESHTRLSKAWAEFGGARDE